jgi:hypothetical protein
VRVARVLLRRNDRRRVADQPFFGEPSGHQLLDLELGDFHTVFQSAGRFLERALLHPVQFLGRCHVSLDLPLVPDGGELLDEVARGNDFDAELLDQLDRAGVDPRDVRDRAPRRILHRDAAHALQQLLQPRLERGASGIAEGSAWKVREGVRFDRMNKGARFAGCGDEVVPPTCREVPPLPADTGDVHGDAVHAVKIVEQPPVEPLRTQRRLDRPDVECRCR